MDFFNVAAGQRPFALDKCEQTLKDIQVPLYYFARQVQDHGWSSRDVYDGS
jgi:hypothetical protein